MKYIKLFDEYSEYQEFITGDDFVTPSFSLCEDTPKVVRYNPSEENAVVAIFQIDLRPIIYFDDFPQEICDDEFNGDMAAFRQVSIDDITNNPENTNAYQYTGEMFNYNGTDYYLWEELYPEMNIRYILTDTTDFAGNSLTDDITNNYCPFTYLLDDDKEVLYTAQEKSDYILVHADDGTSDERTTKIYNDGSVTSIRIDGVKMTEIQQMVHLTDGGHRIVYTLPSSTVVDDQFGWINEIKSITFPNGIENIGEAACCGCEGLEKVTIGTFVEFISADAFSECTSLTSVTVLATNPPFVSSNAFDHNASGRKIYVPAESVNAYKAADGWSAYASAIEAIPTE